LSRLNHVNIDLVEKFENLGLLNKKGLPRLGIAYYYFVNSENLDDLRLLVELYRYWRDLDERVLIRKSWWENFEIKSEYIAYKCSKRGNDVYRYRVRKRLGWIERVRNFEFFNDKEVERGEAYACVLFFTLTYDVNRCSRGDAWENVGKEYNRWISRVRRKYGHVSVLRVWQSFKNGYPHVHGIIWFKEAKFKVFKHRDVDGSVSYRVYHKGDLETSWHSFVDVVAIKNLRGALVYVKRYITRVQGQGNDDDFMSDLSMALAWLFRKRTFSLSGDFRKLYSEYVSDLINGMHNSNLVQSFLGGGCEPKKEVWYEFLGVFVWWKLVKYGFKRFSRGGWVQFLDRRVEEIVDED